MEEEKKLKIQKKLKRNNGILIGAIILFLLMIGMIIWIYMIQNAKLEDPHSMHDVIASGVERENVYAKMDAQLLTECFATYGDGSSTDKRYYFASDGTYTYILNLTVSQFNEMKTIYEFTYDASEDAIVPDPIEVTGVTAFIPTDIREIAIDAYNEMMEEELLTEENFDEYIGSMCIQVGTTPRDNYVWQFVIAFTAGVMGIALLFIYLNYHFTTKKTLKKYANQMDEIYQEVEAEETNIYNKEKLYITKNYLLDLNTGLNIIKLSEIEWMYPHEYRRNGISTKSIVVVTSDGKRSQISKMEVISKKAKETFDEIYNKISEKTPNAMNGYTKENIKAMKEKDKERKQNKI